MIVGTAGHIDHGKSALVRALTGVDTDRLKDEKARGISIDLGFAYLPVADGSPLGFVDVPGHDRFVRNMLAGATGIDALLMVVAADDGVMPQTREHLAIVDLLGVPRGLVALTKIDLVPPDWRDAMIAEVRALLAGTRFAQAEIMPVSATTGEGVEALRDKLRAMSATFHPRAPEGRFRLAVDRCFTLQGAGTVVTGPVLSGAVEVGDSVMLSPSGRKARVRSIHAQNEAAQRGVSGQRCALNLVGEGISRHVITRGDMVLDSALHAPAERIDCAFRLLPSEPRPLAHWTPVHVHHAAVEVPGRVALLGEGPIAPGETSRIQLVLDRPIAACADDRFVLRDTSGSRTIGGGRFLDLRAPHRRRRVPNRLAQLDALAHPDPAEALGSMLGRWPHHVAFNAFARDRGLSEAQGKALLAAVPHRALVAADDIILLSPAIWESLSASASAAVGAFHQNRPDLIGMTPLRLVGALEPRLPPRVAEAVIAALIDAGVLVSQGGAIRTPEHRLDLDDRDQLLWERMAPLLDGAARFRPPRVVDIAQTLRLRESEVRRLFKAMARQREVVEIVPDHFFLRDTVEEIAAIVGALAAEASDGYFPAASLRDRLDNGRKVAIQLLDYFDRQGVTLRREDLRCVDARRLRLFLGTAGALAA